MTAHPLPWLAADRDGAVTGYAYASRHRERAAYRWSVETPVHLAPAEQGRGTGRALHERPLAALGDDPPEPGRWTLPARGARVRP